MVLTVSASLEHHGAFYAGEKFTCQIALKNLVHEATFDAPSSPKMSPNGVTAAAHTRQLHLGVAQLVGIISVDPMVRLMLHPASWPH